MRIVVFSKNWLGDAIFELPVFEALRRKYPESHIACIAPKRCREILDSCPHVNEFLEFDEKDTHRSTTSRWLFSRLLKKKGPWDLGVLLHGSATRSRILKSAKVQEVIGYETKKNRALTKSFKEPEETLHHVDYHLNLLKLAGINIDGIQNYKMELNQDLQSRAENIMKKRDVPENFCCFHLGANWQPKRWPIAHFAKLAELLQNSGIQVVVTGGPGDQGLDKKIRSYSSNLHVISLIGLTGFMELGAVLNKAKFLVTADSGPMHLASAVGTPVIALFGPTNPNLTGPRGIGKSEVISYIPEGYEAPWLGDLPKEGWMEHISPEQVFEKVKLLTTK